jgi:hypothetical protein
MFDSFDRKIEKVLIKRLHKHRQSYLDKAIAHFNKTHPTTDPSVVSELRSSVCDRR